MSTFRRLSYKRYLSDIEETVPRSTKASRNHVEEVAPQIDDSSGSEDMVGHEVNEFDMNSYVCYRNLFHI